jgi:hypothetical protein
MAETGITRYPSQIYRPSPPPFMPNVGGCMAKAGHIGAFPLAHLPKQVESLYPIFWQGCWTCSKQLSYDNFHVSIPKTLMLLHCFVS